MSYAFTVNSSLPYITPETGLELMGYLRRDRSDLEIARDLVDGTYPPLVANDPILWQKEHTLEARQAFQLFYPEQILLTTPLITSTKYPYLAFQPDALSWGSTKGVVKYHCPFSQQLPVNPSPFQELRLAFMGGMMNWARPSLYFVAWTPSASLVKEYRRETVLIQEPQLTLGELWEDLLLPRLEGFYRDTLLPLLEERGRSYFAPDQESIVDNNYTPEQLIKALAREECPERREYSFLEEENELLTPLGRENTPLLSNP